MVDKDRVIIVGDTRYQAARALGMKSVPIQIAKNLSPEQVIAYRLADNRVGEVSEWDDAKLINELSLIENAGFDLSGMGFTDKELGLLEKEAKVDNRFLQDFEVMPVAQQKWILIRAPEDQAVEIISAVKGLELEGVRLEYSGEPGDDKKAKSLHSESAGQ